MNNLMHLLASLFAFAGLLAGRIASMESDDFVEWRTVAGDSIVAGQDWVDAWKSRR